MTSANTSSWYIVQFKPNSHKIALRNLERQGFEPFFQMHELTRRTAIKFETVIKPLFTGYMFLDEHSWKCLAIRLKRKLNSTEVIGALTDLFILRGAPAYIRSDNGAEFIAEAVRDWIKAVGAKTAYF